MGGSRCGEVTLSAPPSNLAPEGSLGKWPPFPSWDKKKKYTYNFKIKFIGVTYTSIIFKVIVILG